jgi:hypothetical protein
VTGGRGSLSQAKRRSAKRASEVGFMPRHFR